LKEIENLIFNKKLRIFTNFNISFYKKAHLS
jgi:hypothetical protein